MCEFKFKEEDYVELVNDPTHEGGLNKNFY